MEKYISKQARESSSIIFEIFVAHKKTFKREPIQIPLSAVLSNNVPSWHTPRFWSRRRAFSSRTHGFLGCPLCLGSNRMILLLSFFLSIIVLELNLFLLFFSFHLFDRSLKKLFVISFKNLALLQLIPERVSFSSFLFFSHLHSFFFNADFHALFLQIQIGLTCHPKVHF